MPNTKIDSATTTDMNNSLENYEVSPGTDTGDYVTKYSPDWTKWLGFLQFVPEIESVISKKAMWTVGKGFKASTKTTKQLRRIKGNGKETFNSIMFKAIKTYTAAGDYFAEIIKKNGQLHNLKTLNPGRVEIETDSAGFIKKYNYLDRNGKKQTSWDPEEIFHLMWNPQGDNTHGTSTIQKLTYDNDGRPGIIEMYNEAKQDLKTVFHRYVKPLLISSVDTDNEEEIEAYKTKLDNSVKNGENLVIPKDTVDSIERVSIPQFSTLDPLPWLSKLEQEFIKAEGVPLIIQGQGADTTEATAKILYLAFQQMIEWNQLFLEEQIAAQLGINVEFNFPADLLGNLQADERKDGTPQGVKKSEIDPRAATK